MPTTHGQPGLSSDQRSDIRRTILSARHTLEAEIRRRLTLYGIHDDDRQELEALSHLSVEQRRTREQIDAALERELESTEGDLERSITNYVREATKTYLNRFVALKAIEVRGLVEETITERTEYGNRSYVQYTVAEIAGELTDGSDDGYGAALDIAYEEIGAEIQMLFEETDHTAIDLDAQVREEVLDSLEAIDDEAWASDEALGWVYQYFGEEERDEIDGRVDDDNYKIAGTDIATKTQLFTPRYIVEWMVDNSLGRTWLEMRGEATDIDDEDNCFYLAPLEDSLLDREEKAVEEITVLDPACGSGHLLFYAFDVLYQMYLEAGEVPEAYIPREILRNNLYGIDIDSGAAQIAALSLYLKAKERSPDVTIPQMNIVSADAVLIDGDRKREVLDRARSELEAEILEQVWQSFDNIREFGSLVQIEDRIDEVLAEYRETFESQGQTQFTEDGDLTAQSTFASGAEAETWDDLKAHLLEAISDLASEALEHNDPIEEMFAGEVGKTVELLDLLVRDYDVTISNPPYLGSSKTDDTLKNFVSDHYVGNRDLYGAFIERAWQFTDADGYCSVVTPENYLFISSFTDLRREIVQDKTVVEGAHLSGYSFSEKDRPFTIPMVLRNSRPPENGSRSRLLRLTHEQPAYDAHEKKIRGLNDVVRSLRDEGGHPDEYVIDQNVLRDVRRSPFVYWFGSELLELFREHDSLGAVSKISGGVKTGDNERFLRKFWEVPRAQIGEQFEWYVKNGEYVEYYDKIDTLVEWEDGGTNIIEYSEAEGTHYQGLSNTDWYFDESVIYRDFSRLFVAKRVPEGCLFSSTVYRVRPDGDVSAANLLGYMNSSLYRYLASGINPTLHYKPGDAGAVPVKAPLANEDRLERYVSTAIERRTEQFKLVESARSFSEAYFADAFRGGIERYLLRKDAILAEIGVVRGLLDEIIFDEYDVSERVRERVYESQTGNLAAAPYYTSLGRATDVEYGLVERVPTADSEADASEVIEEIRESDDALLDTAETLEVSPYTVADVRAEHGHYSADERREAAGRLLSYLLGELFGRWDGSDDLETPDDEILLFDRNEQDDVGRLVLEHADELLPQDRSRIESDLAENLGRDHREWFRDRFFRDHHCKEYRRRGQRIPIYWQLESPDGAFSCFVYYHDVDENTLPKLRGQYLDPRIEELRNELETLRAQTSGDDPDAELLERREEVEQALADVEDFHDRIDRMIDDDVTVDVEDGIWENIKEWDQYEVLQTGLPKLKSSYSR